MKHPFWYKKLTTSTAWKLKMIIVADSTQGRTTKRRRGIGRHQLFALKDANANVTNNIEEVFRVAEEFYTELYSDQDG